MSFSRRVFVAIALTATLFVAAKRTVLYGTYTGTIEPSTFDAINTWLDYGNALPQAVRIINHGWTHTDKIFDQIEELGHTWVFKGAVPIVTWMPYPYKTWTNPSPCKDIVNGTYDTYIDAYLSRLSKGYTFAGSAPRKAYLRFAPQPNGNWFPWSPSCGSCSSTGQNIDQTAQDYQKMWTYVMDKVRDKKYNLTKDVLQVIFDVSAVNENDKVESFYPPGKTPTVDWGAITGINWGTSLPGNQWVSPSTLFGPAYTSLTQLSSSSMPIAILSAASTSVPNGVAAKDSWIKELMCSFAETNTNIRMITYHNDDGATDTAVFGGKKGDGIWNSTISNASYNVYPEFRKCIVSHTPPSSDSLRLMPFVTSSSSFWLVGRNNSLDGLITQKAFMGN